MDAGFALIVLAVATEFHVNRCNRAATTVRDYLALDT